MNTDIRLSVNFFDHTKTYALDARLGKEGIVCLLKLWVWAAVKRPSGDLSGYCSGILEKAAGWQGEPGSFVEGLLDIGWLDGEDNSFRLHGWEEAQPWVVTVNNRESSGRLGFLARKNAPAYERLKALGYKGITKAQYTAMLQPDWQEEIANWQKQSRQQFLARHGEGGKAPSKVKSRSPSSPAPVPAPSPSPSPSPLPSPSPSPTPYVGRGEAEESKDPKDKEPKDPEQAFEGKWNGDQTIKKFNPLDYIRRIQEIAGASAPQNPEQAETQKETNKQ